MHKFFIPLFLFFVIPVFAFANEDDHSLSELVSALTREINELTFQVQLSVDGQMLYKPLSADEQREIILQGVQWFKNAQEENGHFKYEYVPYEDRYVDDNNIVRQAGALYQLGEILKKDPNDVHDLKETVERAIDYFDGLSKETTFNDETFRCIRSSRVSLQCKLGATALALVGLLDYLERYPDADESYKLLAEDYKNYILAMKLPDAGFRYLYYNERSKQQDNESSFSNGEALLALVRYYQYDPGDEVKEMIDEMFVYLRDETPFDTPLYLWVMAALKNMAELWDDESYVEYAAEYTDWRVSNATRFKSTERNWCAYNEGVASALSVLRGEIDESVYQLYERDVNFWARKHHELQVSEVDLLKLSGDGSSNILEIEKPELALGGFLTSRSELKQRIDFTQHCLSVYLQKLVDVDGESLNSPK